MIGIKFDMCCKRFSDV